MAGFATPAFVLIIVLFLVPLVTNTALAFTNWSGFQSDITYSGLENLRDMARQRTLIRPARLTLSYALTAMFLQNAAGLGLALALQRSNRINGFFRSVFFLPVLLSPLAAGYIWRGLLEPRGAVNSLLSALLPREITFAWLGTPEIAIFTVASVEAWKWFGMATLVYIAGLNSIPADLEEAALLDGTSSWQLFWHVKRPLLAPAVTFNVTLTLIGSMSAFETILATTRGGPGDATTVLNILMLRQFGQGLFGFATATTLIVTLMVIVVSIPLIWLLRRREVDL